MAKFIGKVQIKKWLIAELKPFLKKEGYSIKSSVNVEIETTTERILNFTGWQVHSDDSVAFGAGRIRIKKVEDILYSITALEMYKLITPTISILIPSNVETKKVITCREDIEEIAGTFKTVFQKIYLPRFKHYSEPKNILSLWDVLETDKERGKVFQDSNNISKILIISRMVNDSFYRRRVEEGLDNYQRRIDNGEKYFEEELSNCRKVIGYLNANEIVW